MPLRWDITKLEITTETNAPGHSIYANGLMQAKLWITVHAKTPDGEDTELTRDELLQSTSLVSFYETSKDLRDIPGWLVSSRPNIYDRASVPGILNDDLLEDGITTTDISINENNDLHPNQSFAWYVMYQGNQLGELRVAGRIITGTDANGKFTYKTTNEGAGSQSVVIKTVAPPIYLASDIEITPVTLKEGNLPTLFSDLDPKALEHKDPGNKDPRVNLVESPGDKASDSSKYVYYWQTNYTLKLKKNHPIKGWFASGKGRFDTPAEEYIFYLKNRMDSNGSQGIGFWLWEEGLVPNKRTVGLRGGGGFPPSTVNGAISDVLVEGSTGTITCTRMLYNSSPWYFWGEQGLDSDRFDRISFVLHDTYGNHAAFYIEIKDDIAGSMDTIPVVLKPK